MLIFLVGGLIVYTAYSPAFRVPILASAAIEKIAIGLLIFFGPMKRTRAMIAIALGDGTFALIYAAYLAKI